MSIDMYLLNEVLSRSNQARLVAVCSFRVAVINIAPAIKKNEATCLLPQLLQEA